LRVTIGVGLISLSALGWTLTVGLFRKSAQRVENWWLRLTIFHACAPLWAFGFAVLLALIASQNRAVISAAEITLVSLFGIASLVGIGAGTLLIRSWAGFDALALRAEAHHRRLTRITTE